MAVICVMIFFSSWISLRTVQKLRLKLLSKSLSAILLGAGLTLIFITQIVFQLDPWYQPRYMVPLAGMIFAGAMNSISLAGERFFAEIKREEKYTDARNAAYRASLIPIMNSLFAVGLVSMPGMMTGQILSGVSPLVAIRYQIVVMGMRRRASQDTAAAGRNELSPTELAERLACYQKVINIWQGEKA